MKKNKGKTNSIFALHAIYKKGFSNGSTFWRYFFYFTLIFKILKWLFAKPQPHKIDEFELEPGEYKLVMKENLKKNKKAK